VIDDFSIEVWTHTCIEVGKVELVEAEQTLMQWWLLATYGQLAYPGLKFNPSKQGPSVCEKLAGPRKALYWRDQFNRANDLVKDRDELRHVTTMLRQRLGALQYAARRRAVLDGLTAREQQRRWSAVVKHERGNSLKKAKRLFRE
jgi:hypothetical protein